MATDAGVPLIDALGQTEQVDNVTVVTPAGKVQRQRIAMAASLDRKLLDYAGRTDGNPVYVGFAQQTAKVADATWVVYQLFYDSSARLIDQQVAEQIAWTDRTTGSHWRAAGGD